MGIALDDIFFTNRISIGKQGRVRQEGGRASEELVNNVVLSSESSVWMFRTILLL